MIVRSISEKTTKSTLFVLFVIIGTTAILARGFIFPETRILSGDQIWKITFKALVESQRDITLIDSNKPKTSANHRLIGQYRYHPDFKIVATKKKPATIKGKALKTGLLDWYITYQIQKSQNTGVLKNKIKLTTDQRENYLLLDPNVNLSSVRQLNEYLKRDSKALDVLFSKIYQYTYKLLLNTNRKYDDLNNIVVENKATTFGRARLMTMLCRLNNIPARLVTGFKLEESTAGKIYYWVEVYNEDEQAWQSYDPEKGYEKIIPGDYVAFVYDATSIHVVENGTIKSEKVIIEEDIDTVTSLSLEQKKSILDVLDLRRFDYETRQTLTKLLLLPFCVLLVAFIRHVLGFYPYGTFTAPILALAMVHAELQVTLVITFIVIFLALMGRSIMPKSITRTPRLSLILTFVVISMVASVSILAYIDVNASGNIILLPTIILVAIVDRFYSYMDRAGAHAASIRLVVTVFIALLSTPIFELENLGKIILTYPEAHFFTAALLLLLSSYQGKKLTDIPMLNLLGENKKINSSKFHKNHQ